MIESTSAIGSQATGTTMPSVASSAKGPFDDALDAARRAQAAREAQASELAQIREKGFSAWARDTRIEKLKEELRRKTMAAMGLTDKDLAAMNGAMRRILEEKIEAEVEKQLAQLLAQADHQKDGEKAVGSKSGQGHDQDRREAASVVLAAQEESTPVTEEKAEDATGATEPGKKDRAGKTCLVIPALSTPGGASLF